MTESREHAVVIGGSLAGLLAARVLTDHFDRVTVVERDRFPADPVHRAGVGQGRHLHVLWTRGLEIGEAMFPGLGQEMSAAGAPELKVPADVLWLTSAGWRRRFDVTRMLTFSRGLLDHTVRRHLMGRVTFIEGHEVTGLIPGAGHGVPRAGHGLARAGRNISKAGQGVAGAGRSVPRGGQGVAGVEIRERGAASAATEALKADLVVDASGRGSRTPEWLARLGYPFPQVTTVDPLLGYASRFYAIPPGFDPGWKALYIQADPPGTKRTGGLFPQEGGRWIVSLSGAGRDYGPTGEREFLEFAKALRSPILYDAIRNAEPLSPIVGYRRTANHRRHYERLPTWPEGFVAVGDSVCAFNPIYGQGMTVAALEALTLDALLAANDPRRLARRFQKLAARNGAGAWLIATGEDLRYRETEGSPVRLRTKLTNRYVDRVVAVANVDRDVCRSLLDVLALTTTPYALFKPATLTRVLTTRAHQPTGPDDLLPRPATTELGRSVTGA